MRWSQRGCEERLMALLPVQNANDERFVAGAVGEQWSGHFSASIIRL